MSTTSTYPVYITKYALTRGIIKCEATFRSAEPLGYAIVKIDGMTRAINHKDWHTTLLQAQRRVSDLKRAKIAALQKQIAKLYALDVKVVKK